MGEENLLQNMGQGREQLLSELATKNEELNQIIYTISHDLKGPIFTLKGFISCLKDDFEKKDMKSLEQDLEEISNAVDRINDLVENLLKLSRASKSTARLETISIRDVAQDALKMVEISLKKREVSVEMSSELPTCYGERIRILEIFVNLIDNAVKFMGDQEKPRIKIGSRKNGDEEICFVSDNGIGIDEKYHTKVFEIFWKLDKKKDGFGLGLHITKKIVESYKGRIWVESEGVGKGSTFCFTIPVQKIE